MDNALVTALQLAQTGDWDGAHEIVQKRSDSEACWIHAYLHRVEGDDGNAGYWYRQAGRDFPTISLDDEWQQIYDYLSAK